MTEPYDADPADEALESRLRAADPAASLPPAAPESVARLLEETMSHDPSAPTQDDPFGTGAPTESRESGTRGRGPLTWLVAAAAAVVIAGTAVFVVVNRDGDGGEVPEAAPTSTAATPTVTELTAGAEPARCMVPTAELLGERPIAFEGTVATIDGGKVTLTPTRWYAGGPSDLVTVDAPSERLQQLLVAVDFEEGGRYLVAANDDGSVMVCGFSGPYSEGLAALYAEAFGG